MVTNLYGIPYKKSVVVCFACQVKATGTKGRVLARKENGGLNEPFVSRESSFHDIQLEMKRDWLYVVMEAFYHFKRVMSCD